MLRRPQKVAEFHSGISYYLKDSFCGSSVIRLDGHPNVSKLYDARVKILFAPNILIYNENRREETHGHTMRINL